MAGTLTRRGLAGVLVGAGGMVMAATLLTGANAAADTRPAAQEVSYRVLTQNVAGIKEHDSRTDTGLVEHIGDLVVADEVDFFGLQELCYQQYQAIQAYLVDKGWPADAENFARYASADDDSCEGQPIGNAVFGRELAGPAERFDLPRADESGVRQLICAQGPESGARFCTTHLTGVEEPVEEGVPAYQRQLDFVRDQAEEYYAAGGTVIMTGDFNAQPHWERLDNWYSSSVDTENNSGNTGEYRELDDTDDDHCPGYGERTVYGTEPPGPCGDKRIDLVFVREDLIAGDYNAKSKNSDTCDTESGRCSDHLAVSGEVTVSIR